MVETESPLHLLVVDSAHAAIMSAVVGFIAEAFLIPFSF